jgi:hypothetical protein
MENVSKKKEGEKLFSAGCYITAAGIVLIRQPGSYGSRDRTDTA